MTAIIHRARTSLIVSLLFLSPVLLSLFTARAGADEYYEVTELSKPEGMRGETGGVTFTPNGTPVAVFHKGGRVFKLNPETEEWQLFAEGLHEPQGVYAPAENKMYVMHRPELTKLVDTTGDGYADKHVTVSNDFGMSGNYHEFAFGPAVGPNGNFYVGLNTASNGAGIWDKDEIRGEFKKNGRPGRMYSCVPYRGWVLKITPSGKTIPWALGFRSPAGIGFDSNGNLFVNDNQGDWLGTNRLYHVERGKFYGHVSSLVWKPGFEGNPLKLPPKKLNAMRTKPAIKYPYGSLSNSPSQPLEINTGGNFGPYEGQLLIGELNHPRIMRVMLEEVAGHLQGAVTTFIDGKISLGNHRMAFGPDHRLLVGETRRAGGWAGSRGLKWVEWTGKTPFDIHSMSLTEYGFDLRFTKPVNDEQALSADLYNFKRYYYKYHRPYGSNKKDVAEVKVQDVAISNDGRTVSVKLAERKPGYIYDLRIGDLTSENGTSLYNNRIAYTLNYLPDGTTDTPQFVSDHGPISFKELANHTLEAERAQSAHKTSIKTGNPGFSGKGYLDPAGTDSKITYELEDVPAGTHTLRVRYALGSSQKRPMEVVVNSKNRATIPFTSTGDWESWKTIEVDVELKKGKNTISLVAGENSGPNIDRIQFPPNE
jgi:glucose/arabinose dehydrogenase